MLKAFSGTLYGAGTRSRNGDLLITNKAKLYIKINDLNYSLLRSAALERS